MAIMRVDHIGSDNVTHALPYPFEQALAEAEYIKALEARIQQLEVQVWPMLVSPSKTK